MHKERHGARARRIHDEPHTPYQRVLPAATVSDNRKAGLQRLYATLNAAELRRQLTQLQEQLLDLALRIQPPGDSSREVRSVVSPRKAPPGGAFLLVEAPRPRFQRKKKQPLRPLPSRAQLREELD